ncbi:MAG TPA: glycoside hydrolase family 76 protein [Streptosporangiaceae bacterium]|nr:glycoside hydrolase family 76 protein [Streptosporangiaceae bacterium]
MAVAVLLIIAPAVSGDVNSASAAAKRPRNVLAAIGPRKALPAVSPQKSGMAELFSTLNPKTGVMGKTWWQGAIALSTLETYQQATGDTAYSSAIEDAFVANSAGNFENQADDDTSWWALAWLQAYDITGSAQYLSMAETDANYVHEDWDSTCGGGIWWLRNPRTYKNAISNELFLELTAWLHNTIPGDTKYLRWAQAEWAWFKRSGMINKSHLVNDGLSDNCTNNNETTWTYNQGVILAGLAQLYTATRNTRLLTEAKRIATAAIGHLTVRGVLQEPCTGTQCGSESGGVTQSFKGIFVRDLKMLAVTAKTSQFNAFFRQQARSIESRDSATPDQFGMFWAGPPADLTSYCQASAEDALVAALNLP